MSGTSAKDLFLDALTPVSTALNNVTVSVSSIKDISNTLSTAAGTISGFGDSTVDNLAQQLTDNAKQANQLESKIMNAASELQWLADKYVVIIGKSETSKTFTSDMTGYILRKNAVFSPVDMATDLAYLGDQITTTLAEVKSTVDSVDTIVTQLQDKLADAKKKLSKAHSDAYTASVLLGVGAFVQAICNAASVLSAAKMARSQQANNEVRRDEQQVGQELQEIPEPQRRVGANNYARLEDAQERTSRVQQGAMRYLVGSALAQGVGAIFTMSSQLITANAQDPDALNKLQVLVDQLETYTLPLYQDHIMPALNLLDSKIITAKTKLLAMSPTWIVKALNTDTLDVNFAAWKADSGTWSEATFTTELEARKKSWGDLSAAIKDFMANPYPPTPNALNLMAKAHPAAKPHLPAKPLIKAKRHVLRAGAPVPSAPGVSAIDLDATHALIDALSISEASPVSLTQSVNAINSQFSTLLDELSIYMIEPQQLSKQGNELSTSVSMLLSTIEYFASKIDSYLGKMEGKAAQALGALQRKLESILQSIPAILSQITTTSGLCDTISQTLSGKIDVQEKAITAALAEFNAQKAKVQEIINEEERNKAAKSQRLGAAFKRMLKDGLFSKATLDFIATLLGVDLSDSSKLDDAKASLEAINSAIDKATAEKQAYQVAKPSLAGSQAGVSQLKVGLSLITPILTKKEEALKEAAKTVVESEIDWGLFNSSTPNIVSGWKAWYNSLVVVQAPLVQLDNVMVTKAVSPTKIPMANAKIVKTRSGARVFEAKPSSRPMLRLAAASASTTPPSAGVFREKVKEALAPAADATKNAVDITSDVKLIQTKLDDMLAKLGTSSYAAELVNKVANFKKDFNALEVDAKKLATQIYWFADKNIKALNDLEAKAKAGTLTTAAFQSTISYLQRKVATFVTSSSDMTLKHKNLKTDMSVIEGALKSTEATLKDLIPKMQDRLTQAEKDLDDEKDKMKKAAILRAVGGALSSLGQGGGLYAAVSGNAVLAGFSAAGILIGGIMNLVAGLIDGDPNKISQLQATIDQLNIQIPDMQKAQDAMQPCIADSETIQDALERLSNAWQAVNNNLVYVNQDYKSWLAEGFVLDDFLFDVDDNITKWTAISTILKNFADGDPGTEDIPRNLTAAARVVPARRAFALAAGTPDPYQEFLQKCTTFKQHMGETATSTMAFAEKVKQACSNMTEPLLPPFLKEIQQPAAQSVDASVKLETEGMNTVTEANVLSGKLNTLIDTCNAQADQIQHKIDDYNNRSIWDKIRDAFSSFFGNIAHIGSGDFVDIIKGLGSLAVPVYGITQGTIDSIDDAERAVNQLRKAAADLKNQKEQLQGQITDISQKKEAVSSVRAATQNLRDAVVKLKLDVSPNELWQDFLMDKADIESDVSQTIQASSTLAAHAK